MDVCVRGRCFASDRIRNSMVSPLHFHSGLKHFDAIDPNRKLTALTSRIGDYLQYAAKTTDDRRPRGRKSDREPRVPASARLRLEQFARSSGLISPTSNE